MSVRIQCADAKRVLGSVHKVNLEGNVVALGGEKAEQGDPQEDQDHLRAGPAHPVLVGPSRQRAAKEESDKQGAEGQLLCDTGRGP